MNYWIFGFAILLPSVLVIMYLTYLATNWLQTTYQLWGYPYHWVYLGIMLLGFVIYEIFLTLWIRSKYPLEINHAR
jgi:hypothetical protein